jgi:ferredoxin-NADP reductase
MKAILSVKNLVTPDILYLEFTLTEPINFRAGQFFQLTIINPSVTDNRGNKRTFGFVNSPLNNKIASLITHTGTSSFKKYLGDAPLGTEMEIGNPAGELILPDDPSQLLVFITSDIGIAPYISVLRFVYDQSLPYHITLINLPPVVLGNDLNTYAQIKSDFKLLTPESLDTYFLRDRFPDPGHLLFYITGIPRFVTNTVRILHDWGLPPTQIKFEIFTGY